MSIAGFFDTFDQVDKQLSTHVRKIISDILLDQDNEVDVLITS